MSSSLRAIVSLAVLLAGCGARPRVPALPSAGVATGPSETGSPVAAPIEGSCGGLADLSRVETSLLADRVHLALPEGTAVVGGPRSIMAAEPSRARQELAWIERGDGRMAVLAEELYRREAGSLLDDVRAIAPSGWQLEGTSQLVVATPDEVREQDTDARLAYAWWRDADGHVVALVAVTDPDHARRGGCVALARDLFRTITAGTGRLSLAARTVTLDDGAYLVDLPAGYADSIDDGVDFVVHRFVRVGDFAAVPPASAGVYFGDHPSFRVPAHPDATDVLLGTEVLWSDMIVDGRLRRDGLVGSSVHVFFDAPDRASFDELGAVLRTLRRTSE